MLPGAAREAQVVDRPGAVGVEVAGRRDRRHDLPALAVDDHHGGVAGAAIGGVAHRAPGEPLDLALQVEVERRGDERAASGAVAAGTSAS